jgi:hypothetical protein
MHTHKTHTHKERWTDREREMQKNSWMLTELVDHEEGPGSEVSQHHPHVIHLQREGTLPCNPHNSHFKWTQEQLTLTGDIVGGGSEEIVVEGGH